MSEVVTADRALISKFVPLNGLRPESQKELLENTRIESMEKGKFLFKAGDKVDETFYVIEGGIELLSASDALLRSVTGGEPDSLHRLAHQVPRKVSARCASDCLVLVVDTNLLDVMLTWDQTGSFEVKELAGEATIDESSDDWMTKLLQMRAFQMVPPANLQAMFMRMEQVNLKAGSPVIKQGEDGDYFYVINNGRALVTRESPTSNKPMKLAELGEGSCFGEEALISEAKRNASVTMISSGSLMRLSKQDFNELLTEPLSRKISYADAVQLTQEGAKWLDVRLPSEYQNYALDGAMNIPLYLLRMKLSSLDENTKYIAYCDSGRRSSVAAFVLTQKGYEVYILDGGIPEQGTIPG